MRAAHARPVMVGLGGGSKPLEAATLGVDGYSEAWLQKLIHKHPDCLPVSEIEAGLRRVNFRRHGNPHQAWPYRQSADHPRWPDCPDRSQALA